LKRSILYLHICAGSTSCTQKEIIALSSTETKTRAEATFKRKQDQAREGAKAWQAYEAERRAVDDKTARLKALRLAKEAAEAFAQKK
jgi:hypothetical protein